MVYDWENAWGYQDTEGPINLDRPAIMMFVSSTRTFWEHSITVDVIDLQQDISQYDMVVAPLLYMCPESYANRVRDFVANGGTYVTGVWSGIQ